MKQSWDNLCTMRRFIIPVFSFFIILSVGVWVTALVYGQSTGVFAEAIQQANLRANGDIYAEKVGEIVSGTRYPIIGRNEFAVSTWYLLGDPVTNQAIGWVYFELVTVIGNIDSVPFSTVNVMTPPAPTMTSTPPPDTTGSTDSTSGASTNPEVSLTPTMTETPNFAVYGIVNDEINLRYGPGQGFPRLGVMQAGERLQIVGYHTQFPWVQVTYPNAPGEVAWVFKDLLDIQGDIFTTRAIVQTDFSNQPTLTPTPAVIQGGSVQRGTPVPVSPEFAALGQQLWNTVLEANFDPATSRFGALYLRDLQTGQEITFGNTYAFSGTSINKIAILMDLFGNLNSSPDVQTAIDIANTMICSENVATNRLLSIIGGGDIYAGAADVSAFLAALGLRRTFLTAPYEIPGATPIPPTSPISFPTTDVDQSKARPNLTNQMTVDELGYLLTSLYECAVNESGPLLENFSTYTPQECRKMIHVMANNNVDALLKAGVPADIPVAHKHGWVADTHGNAAIFFTPGGDYVIVMMVYQPEWLEYAQSLPVIAEVSRTVYNFYNPAAPQTEIRDGLIPEANACNFSSSPLINDIISPLYAQTLPFDPLTIGGNQ